MNDNIIPIIIPSYEPDERLITLIKDLKFAKLGPVVIVDDGSGKNYTSYFEECSSLYDCIILRHNVNMGKGRSLKDAFNYCLNTWPILVGCVTADSDGQHTPESIKKIRNALLSSKEDLILGVRNFDVPGVPSKSRIGNKITCQVCKYLCGLDISDTQTGLRGIPSEFMQHLLTTRGERFEFETQMLIESKGHCLIQEVIIETIYDSEDNHTTHFHPILDSIRIYKIFGNMLLKFFFSSFSSSIIDLFLFWIFCGIFRTDDFFYIIIATTLARFISASYNYLINYTLVFHSNSKHTHSFPRYCILAIGQMCASALGVMLIVSAFSINSEVIVKIFVDIFLFFISYVIQRKFVYQ